MLSILTFAQMYFQINGIQTRAVQLIGNTGQESRCLAATHGRQQAFSVGQVRKTSGQGVQSEVQMQ